MVSKDDMGMIVTCRESTLSAISAVIPSAFCSASQNLIFKETEAQSHQQGLQPLVLMVKGGAATCMCRSDALQGTLSLQEH